eukprot:6674942-Prorocentrum_lima.AAC.1
MGAEIVAILLDVEDPAVLWNSAWEIKKKIANCKVAPKKKTIKDKQPDPNEQVGATSRRHQKG